MLETLNLRTVRMRLAYAVRMYESHIQRTHARTYVDIYLTQICLLAAVARGGYERFFSEWGQNEARIVCRFAATRPLDDTLASHDWQIACQVEGCDNAVEVYMCAHRPCGSPNGTTVCARCYGDARAYIDAKIARFGSVHCPGCHCDFTSYESLIPIVRSI